MLTRFSQWFHTLDLADPLERRQGPLLQTMLLALIVENIITVPLSLLSPNTTSASKITGFFVQCMGTITCLFSLWLLRKGEFSKSVNLITFGTVITISILLIPKGLDSPWILFFLYIYPIALAGLIGTRRLLWSIIGLTCIIITSINILELIAPDIIGFDNASHILQLDAIVAYMISSIVLGFIFDSFGPTLRESLKVTQQREVELEQIRANQAFIIKEQTYDLQQAIIDIEQREAVLKQTLDDLRQNEAMLRQLTAPIIPVLPGVLVMPLIGTLDSDRASILTTSILKMVEHTHARSVIFDITGVPVVDTHVARVLVTTSNALRLLGAQVLLVGMRPEVAQTMVTLNVDLGRMIPFASLRDAVESLLPESGWSRKTELITYNESLSVLNQ